MAEKVVVTGGGGFIGSHVVEALLVKGYETHVMDVGVGGHFEGRLHADATYHEIDIRDEKITSLLQGVAQVYHLAALPRVQYSIENPIETFSVNVDGTINLLKAASDAGVRRFVFSSSAAVYGDQPTMPLIENMSLMPKSPYALHKSFGEQACKLWSELYGLETVSLRYFNVYGPRLDPNGAYALAIGKFLRLRKEGVPIEIWGDGTNTRDYVHVSDVARANILAATTPQVGKGEAINIGTGRETDVNTLAGLIGGEVAHVEARMEPGRAQADNRKAKELLGWEPTIALADGITELKKEWGLV